MDFVAAQQFVLSLGHGKMDFDLSRLGRVLTALGVAEPPYPIVLVGGTNGKGSVVTIAESMLAPHLRVGSFVKPHIFHLNERVRMDGHEIPQADFGTLTDELKGYLDRGPEKLTYFEATLALALMAFRNSKAELALIEVGLGGRFDAANALPRVLSVITSISREHEQHLGRRLSEIAFEKAGIMREGVPVILSRQIPREPLDIASILEKFAHLKRSPIQALPAVARRQEGQISPPQQSFTIDPLRETSIQLPEQVSLNLLGTYQERNLEVALAMVDALAAAGMIPAVEIPEQLTVNYRARFEMHPIGRGLVIFDAAHNPEGCAVLARSLGAYFAPEERFQLLFGCQEGKDIRAMLKALAPWVEVLLPLRVDVLYPMSQQMVVEAAREQRIEVAGEGAALLEQTDYLRGIALEGARVLVCGSSYYLGTVMEALGFGYGRSAARQRTD